MPGNRSSHKDSWNKFGIPNTEGLDTCLMGHEGTSLMEMLQTCWKDVMIPLTAKLEPPTEML